MDKQDFEQRIIACKGRLHAIGLAMLTNEMDCKDAVQEALVRAWMRIDTLREPDLFETWLCRILINECKDMLRKRKRQQTTEIMDNIPASGHPDQEVWYALQQLPVTTYLFKRSALCWKPPSIVSLSANGESLISEL